VKCIYWYILIIRFSLGIKFYRGRRAPVVTHGYENEF